MLNDRFDIRLTVLVVEDDPDLLRLLEDALTRDGYRPRCARTAGAALEVICDDVAMAIIDIGLPDADGRDLLKALRSRGFKRPALLLTARDALADKLAGFAAGADDYLTKPFAFAELAVRMSAQLRRHQMQDGAAQTETSSAIALDPTNHAIKGSAGDASLTPTEYGMMATLLSRAPLVVRRSELQSGGWPDGSIVHANTLDQYVTRLRRKLRGIAPEAALLTVRGVGYRLMTGP